MLVLLNVIFVVFKLFWTYLTGMMTRLWDQYLIRHLIKIIQSMPIIIFKLLLPIPNLIIHRIKLNFKAGGKILFVKVKLRNGISLLQFITERQKLTSSIVYSHALLKLVSLNVWTIKDKHAWIIKILITLMMSRNLLRNLLLHLILTFADQS